MGFKLVNNPEFASRISISRYDDRLTELSLSAFKRRASEVKLFLEKATRIKNSVDLKNNPTMELNLDLLISDLAQFVNGMQFHTYVWPLNIMEGPQSDPSTLVNLMKRETVQDFDNIIARIRLFKTQMEEEMSLLVEGVRIGQTMNAHAFQKLIPVLRKLGMTKVEDSQLLIPFKTKPSGISDIEWERIVRDAKQAIITYVTPTYARLARYLNDEYLPRSRPDVGLWSAPNGDALYRGLCHYHTTSPDLSPLDIHNVGLKEVQRISTQMDGVRQRVGFKGTLAQFRQHMRTSDEFGFKDSEDMVNHYKSIRSTVEGKLHRWFNTLPTIKYNIKPVPEDLAPAAPAAYYMEPSPDGRPGTFFINTYDAKKRRKFI